MNIKNIIWGLFSNGVRLLDLKGVVMDGKGTFQRYNETFAEYLDDNFIPFINEFVENTINPDKIPSQFIPLRERHLGLDQPFLEDISFRRKVLKILPQLYKRRGTKTNFVVLLRMIGFDTVEVVEEWITYSLDSPVNLDDPIRRFDTGGRCAACSQYTINLTGSIVISPAILQAIGRVVDFNEPINARLIGVNYNDDSISSQIWGFSLIDGDLIYTNYTENDAIFDIDSNGDLIVNATYSDNFSIINGEVIFNQ